MSDDRWGSIDTVSAVSDDGSDDTSAAFDGGSATFGNVSGVFSLILVFLSEEKDTSGFETEYLLRGGFTELM